MDDYDFDDSENVAMSANASNNHRNKSAAPARQVNEAARQKSQKESNPVATKRLPRPKLDLDRLLKHPRGFKYFRTHYPQVLSLSGGLPGHETSDLAQLVTLWQEWAQLLFPKASIADFVRKVEETCRQTLMKEYLRRLKEATATATVGFDDAEFFIERQQQQLEGLVRGGRPSVATAPASTASVAFEDDELERLLQEKEAKSTHRKRLRAEEYPDDCGAEEATEEEAEDDDEDLQDFINDNSEDDEQVHGLADQNDTLETAQKTPKRSIGIIFDDDE